jgi:hypothetical protein
MDGRTDGKVDRQTDMMKLIVAFRNFANTPKSLCICKTFVLCIGALCNEKFDFVALTQALSTLMHTQYMYNRVLCTYINVRTCRPGSNYIHCVHGLAAGMLLSARLSNRDSTFLCTL